MGLQTQNQKRAKFVMENIGVLKQSNYSDKLSSYILTNGLLPTLAFLNSKDEGKCVYEVIEKYLKNKYTKLVNSKNLIQALSEIEASTLRLITVEIMELANWIRRLVKSEKNGEKEED